VIGPHARQQWWHSRYRPQLCSPFACVKRTPACRALLTVLCPLCIPQHAFGRGRLLPSAHSSAPLAWLLSALTSHPSCDLCSCQAVCPPLLRLFRLTSGSDPSLLPALLCSCTPLPALLCSWAPRRLGLCGLFACCFVAKNTSRFACTKRALRFAHTKEMSWAPQPVRPTQDLAWSSAFITAPVLTPGWIARDRFLLF